MVCYLLRSIGAAVWSKNWSLKKHFWTKKQHSSHCVWDRNKRKKATLEFEQRRKRVSLRPHPRPQHHSVDLAGTARYDTRPSQRTRRRAPVVIGSPANNIRKVKYRPSPVLLGHRAQTNSASPGFMWVNPLFMALPRRNACVAASI